MAVSDSTDSTVTTATFLTRLIAVVALANLFVIVLLALSLRQSRIQYEDRAAISTRNLSLVLEKQLLGTLEKVDLALLSVQDEIGDRAGQGGMDGDRLEACIARQKARLPELDSLRVADAQGVVRYGTAVASSPPTSIADSEHFVLSRDDRGSILAVARPAFSEISKKWLLTLSRRIDRTDGGFAGVVYANIALEEFSRSFSRLAVGPQGSVVLRDRDLGLIARYPRLEGAAGAVGHQTVSEEFRRMIRSGRSSGTYRVRVPYDNVERTLSYRRVNGYPLYLNVGFASREYLAEWRRLAGLAAGLAALFSLITLSSSWCVYRNWKRRAGAVEDLISSREQIRILLESTAEAIYGVDLEGRCTFANPACLRLLGYDHSGKLLGRQMHELCHHSRADGSPFPVLECRISNSFKDGIGIHLDDAIFWRKDGSSFAVECWSYPQLKNHEVVGAVVTFLDITQRKGAQAALQESRQQLLDIIDFLPDATFVIDNEGRVVAWNRAIEEMSGVGKAEMLGQGDHACTVPFYGERRPHLLDLLDVDDAELERKYHHVQRKGKTLNAETFTPALYGGKGAYVWATAAPLYDVEGTRVGAIEAIRDISAHKEADATILSYREHLEELVEQRTQELMLAKEAAEVANRAKTQFMAGMSHELRTPLNAIIGFSDLALQSGLAAGQQDQLRRIRSAGTSLLAMINQILDFSRSEQGTLELERTRFRLDEVLARVIPAVQRKALAKGLQLLLVIPPDLPRQLDGDPQRLGQVLSNLLDNAVKFTALGEVELSLALAERGADAVSLRFAVRDSGVGIPPEQMAGLFESFTQGDASATRSVGGTGVGLPICRSLAALMGGGITVRSAPGEGSTFTLEARFGPVPETGVQEAQEAAPCSAFPWVDASYTLKWLPGQERLYAEVAGKFSKEQHDVVDRLAAAVREGDLPRAGRIARFVEGAAGTLGVSGILEVAAAVEQALQNGEDPSESLQRLACLFNDFAGAVAAALGDAGTPVAGSVAGNDVESMLDKLVQQTSDCDGEALGYFQSVIATLRPALPAAPWDDIERLLESYELDEAAELLRAIIKEMG